MNHGEEILAPLDVAALQYGVAIRGAGAVACDEVEGKHLRHNIRGKAVEGSSSRYPGSMVTPGSLVRAIQQVEHDIEYAETMAVTAQADRDMPLYRGIRAAVESYYAELRDLKQSLRNEGRRSA